MTFVVHKRKQTVALKSVEGVDPGDLINPYGLGM